jgi:membrane associated rhomboid family serine protease
MGISVLVALLSSVGSDRAIVEQLFISAHPQGPLVEISQGQIWRLITPIFIHFGFVHLLFNMLWLKDLGAMIEGRQGSRMFLALVMVVAVLSGLGQYLLVGPFFGGMSGVVYGLFGFVWMKSLFEPASGFRLHRQTVIMMIGWFFLCLTGLLGPIGNVAHGVGLVIGIVWGFISARTRSAAAPPPPQG